MRQRARPGVLWEGGPKQGLAAEGALKDNNNAFPGGVYEEEGRGLREALKYSI